LFPTTLNFLSPAVSWLLAGIFLLSSLSLDIRDVLRESSRFGTIILYNTIMLVVLPVVVYWLTNQVAPSLAIPLLLLAAMPAGMTDPLFTKLLGGNSSLALVLTVSSSLLAPLTVPAVISLTAGQTVVFSFWDMAGRIALLIIVPFLMGQVIKKIWPHIIKYPSSLKSLSLLLLGLLVTGVLAKQLTTHSWGTLLGDSGLVTLSILLGFFILLHLVSYFGFTWLDSTHRKSAVICFTYMNFTLAIVLAEQFFGTSDVVIPVVLSVIPWAILVLPLKYLWKTS
jgi:BASS family bile acid:Na+ symporter